MVRDDMYISAPSYFLCPISLDIMKSPVSLCTGVTYDRSSIQRWLDGGNNTCPATMQVLQNKDLIPNYTLQRLIKIWSDSVLTQPPNSPPQLLQSFRCDQATELIHRVESNLQITHKNVFLHSSVIIQNLSRLSSFAAESDENGRFLAAAGGRILPLLVSVLGKAKDLSSLEIIVSFCNVLLKNFAEAEDSGALKSRIEIRKFDLKSPIMIGLKEGKLQLRISIAKFLDLMARHLHLEIHSSSISEDDEFFSELLRLITASGWDPEAMDASLSLLIRLSLLKTNKAKLVAAGGVRVLAAALWEGEMNASSTEKVLKLLEMVLSNKEGRSEICASEICVKAILKKLLKVSDTATEHAVTVVWSLCCLFGQKRAVAAAVDSNGMAKILVVLQSSCSPAVRQMCSHLLRIFRCSPKMSCVSWYDTKTTHIMPF